MRARQLPVAVRLGVALLVTLITVAASTDSADIARAHVQTLNGNHTYAFTDVRPPDGGPLFFRRTYNSLDSRVGPLGPGWTHNYNVRLVKPTGNPPEDWMFIGPWGRQDVYAAKPDGSYEPSPSGRTSLTRMAPQDKNEPDPNVYAVTYDDGTIYEATSYGLITTIRQSRREQSVRLGQQLVQAEPTLKYRLTQAYIWEARRVLSFDYDEASGRLVSVKDRLDPPREVSYGYDERGRLVSVTNRVGQVTRYTYHGDTSFLHEIVDARGNVAMTTEYDETGHALRQWNARGRELGRAITFSYDKQVADGTQTTMTHPPSTFAPGGPTTIVDTYDREKRGVRRETVLAGGDEPLVEEHGPTQNGEWGVTRRTGGRTAPLAAGGNELTTVKIPGRAVPFSVGMVVPAGPMNPGRPDTLAWSRLSLLRSRATETTTDAAGRIDRLLVPSGTDPCTCLVRYDGEDRILSIADETEEGSWFGASSYQYDEVGNLVEMTQEDGVTRFEYDNRDSVASIEYPPGERARYEYDERGNLAWMQSTGKPGEPTRTVEYEHDGLGRLRRVNEVIGEAGAETSRFVELGYDQFTVTRIVER